MPVFAVLQEDPILQRLDLHQILQFLRLSSILKNDINLCQPARVSVEEAPDVLPPSVASFLSDATEIPLQNIDHCWDVLKNDAWGYPSSDSVIQEDEQIFVEYGWAGGLCKYCGKCAHCARLTCNVGSSVLYPPTTHCSNLSCTMSSRKNPSSGRL
jgi:hypothetical protein